MKILNYIVLGFSFLCLSCEGPIFQIPEEPDSTPPVLTITFPPDQAILSDTVLVTAYAFDNDELEMVNVYLNDSIIIASKEGPFQFSWITKDYGEDEYFTIYAIAEDISGNSNQTNPIQVLVDNEDNINPTGTLIYPYTGQILSGEITIIIEADDNESVDRVIIYIEGDTVASIMNKPYSYTWDTSVEVDDITYTIHAHVVDIAGNQITLGPISVLIDNFEEEDNIPPSGNITYPPASATVSGIIDIQVTAYDDHEVGYVDFIIDGSAASTDSIYPYEYSWNTTEVTEDAEHVINVSITDWIGNTTALFPVSVYVDNVEEPDESSPSVVLAEPAANQTLSGIVSIVAIPSDDVGVNRVEFYHGNTLAGTVYSSPYDYEWDTTLEEDDTQHIWFVKAYDTSENEAQTQPIAVYVDNDDNTPPSGFILYPYAGQTLSGIVEIQVSASDNIGIGSVEFIIDGVFAHIDFDDPFSYTWDTSPVSEDDEHVISITISDQSGNETDLPPIAVFVNNDPPTDDSTPPVVALLAPVSGQTVSDSVLIIGFASDNFGIDHVKFFIDDELVETVPDSPYTHLWNTYDLANDSEHTIRLEAQDYSGNESSAQPVFVIIQNVYEQEIDNLSIVVSEESISLSWDAPYDAVSYKVYRDSSFIGETTEQTYEDTPDAGLEYCYQVSAVNHLGIEGFLSENECGVALLPAPDTFEASVDESDITLVWSSIENASGYTISRNGDEIWSGIETTITDAELDENTTYLYTVNAFDFEATAGTMSDPLSVTTHIELIAPELTINIGTGEIDLYWSSVATAETYRIYKDGALDSETDDLSFTLTINGGTVYCFTITAVNEYSTEGPASNEECGEALFSSPENLSGTVAGNDIALTWANVDGASSYSLIRDGDGVYNGTGLSYDDLDLDYNTTYNYTVSSVNTSGNAGPASSSLEITTNEELIAPILSLSVTDSTASLNWTSVPAASFYRVYIDGAFLDEISATEYEIILNPGVVTCFTIIAIDQSGDESDPSNEECGEAILSAPENFSGTVSQNNITLTWSPVTGASAYSLARDGGEIYNGSDLSYDDNDLEYGTTYNYTILTINSSGDNGPGSSPLELTTHDEITAPVLSLSVTDSIATLNWISVETADHYRIYQDGGFMEEVTETTQDIDIGTGVEICFTVTAVNEYNTESDHSNEECGTGS